MTASNLGGGAYSVQPSGGGKITPLAGKPGHIDMGPIVSA